MPVDESLVGRVFPPTTPYTVSEGKVREFLAATGEQYEGGPAPATFPIVLAFDAMNAFLEAESIDLFRIVHGEQKFVHHRPLTAGDDVVGVLHVDSVRAAGGHAMVTTRTELSVQGEPVCTAVSTLVIRGDE